MDQFSLFELLDEAVPPPEFSNINVLALRSLLRAMLGHLGLQDLRLQRQGEGQTSVPEGDQPAKAPPVLEKKGNGAHVMEQQPQEPGEQLPGKDGVQQTTSGPQLASIADNMGWIKEKVEENESSISQATALLQDVLKEMGTMKAAQSRMDEEMRNMQEALGLEGTGSQSAPAETAQADIDSQHGTSSALESKGAATQSVPRSSTVSPGSWTTTAGLQAGSPSTQITTTGVQGPFPGSKTTTPGEQPGFPGTWTAAPRLQQGSSAMPHLQDPAMPWGASASGSTSGHRVEMVETVPQVGQLGHLKEQEQVDHQEAAMSGHTECEEPHLLFPEGDEESITIQGRVSSLQSLATDLQEVKEKIRQLEDAIGKLAVAGSDRKADGNDQIIVQLGSVLQEIKQEVMELKALGLEEMKREVLELKELGEHWDMTEATLKRLVTEVAEQMQVQQDKLRETESVGQEQAAAQAACSTCSGDTGVQVGKLLQRYEKLRETVDSLMSRQAVGKVPRQMPRRSQQDEEVLKRIQATLMQVQGDHEKLSSVVGNLLHNSHQQQKDTKALFQSLEKLAEENANKEDLLLAVDMKADKSALAGKVNRSEFDTRMERLTQMVEEMLSRQTGQEKVQKQLGEEVASKLDRLELGPFRQQLEGHCKTIVEQGKEKEPEAAADDAAGIKKPLLTHFQCLSCDRPLDMRVPGPHTVAIPALPPLLPHLTEHPRTVLKPEQEQQHGHREPLVEGKYPTVPRSCGGRHTVTTPLQRRQRLQPLLLPNKCKVINLLGMDDPISRDRLDAKLPTLTAKDEPRQPKTPQEQPGLQKAAESTDSSIRHFSMVPTPPRDRPSTRAAMRAQRLFKK